MHHQDDRYGRGDRQDRMWRKFEAMGRRGFGGFGGARGFGGMGGDWGDSFRIGRMLASGDLRLIALYFIEQQPRHGYDLIKAIEEKTSGTYSPSPGVIYPALTYLEEAGFVTSTAEANKRLYTITDEGKAHLDDNRKAVESTLAHLGGIGEQFANARRQWEEAGRHFRDGPHQPDRDMDDVEPDVNEARKELKQAIKEAAKNRDPENQQRLADIMRRAAAEIRDGKREKRVDIEIDL